MCYVLELQDHALFEHKMLAVLNVFLIELLKLQFCDFYREEIEFNDKALVKEKQHGRLVP